MFSTVLVCLVVGISDGDSMTVRCAAAEPQRQVRIHAIDAPERHQSFSEAARNSLSALCLDSRARILPVDTDDYARTVAQVECRGEDAASHQVGAGLAWVNTTSATAAAILGWLVVAVGSLLPRRP